MAYFILPGAGRRIYRLALARRIVDRNGGARGARTVRGAARRRTRVLRQAMRSPRRLRVGLGPWLRALPGRLPDAALTEALAPLDPPVRVAFVLLNIAGMPRYAVRDQLVALRVRDPRAVIEKAEAVQAPVEAPEPPGSVDRRQARPVRSRSPIPVAAGTALTAVLVGALVAGENGVTLFGGAPPAAAHDAELVTATPGAWTRAPRSLDVWPARGDLVDDRTFTARAHAAWSAAAQDRGGLGGGPQLLFAGTLDGRRVAVLRQDDRVGHFTGPDGPLDVSVVGTGPSRPIALGGGRYLLAPWTKDVRTPAGERVTTGDGVTAPVHSATPCRRGPVLRLDDGTGPWTVGDLGGRRTVTMAYRPPSAEVSARPPSAGVSARPPSAGISTRTDRGALDGDAVEIWERMACSLPRPARPVTGATAWEFWSGRLPKGGGPGHWVCASMAFAGGGTVGQSSLLESRKARPTGWCDDRRPVAGTWWRDGSGRWRYLAAAARGLVPAAEGTFKASGMDARLLVATPPRPKHRPDGRVTLTAAPK